MDERKTVLHLITRLDPGGSAENTVLSAERVDPTRYSSLVWTGLGLKGAGPPEEYRKRLADRLTMMSWLVRPVQPFTDIRALFALTNLLKKEKPDILHLHSAKAGALGRVAARLARIHSKIIYTPHGHVFSGYGGSTASRLFTIVEKRLASWCDAIVGLTSDEIHAFLDNQAGRREQFCVIPSGVELPASPPSEKIKREVRISLGIDEATPLIGFVGRLEQVKGPDLFIDAAALVHHQRQDVRFIIIGDGSMRHTVDEKIQQLGLDDAVIRTGWRDNIAKLMTVLDILVLTSRNEGQGRVLVEAMGAALPTVAMNSGGVKEVVSHGETGILVESGDSPAAAEAILGLLDNPEQCREMGHKGFKRAHEQYTVDVMIRRLEMLYDGLLAGEKPGTLLPETP